MTLKAIIDNVERSHVARSDNMVEFIDKTSARDGTPINRENLMAIQGFETRTTTYKTDGTIVETNSLGQTLTTIFNDDGTITEKFVGEKTITCTYKFNSNGKVVTIS